MEDEGFLNRFKKCIRALERDMQNVSVWVELAILMDEINEDEGRSLSAESIREADPQGILPFPVWSRVLEIDPNNIQALEALVEMYVDIYGDVEAGKPFIDRLLVLDANNFSGLRFRIIYDCCSEVAPDIKRAEEVFVDLVERDHENVLWYGLYDYFEDDLSFLGEKIPSLIELIKNDQQSGYNQSVLQNLEKFI